MKKHTLIVAAAAMLAACQDATQPAPSPSPSAFAALLAVSSDDGAALDISDASDGGAMGPSLSIQSSVSAADAMTDRDTECAGTIVGGTFENIVVRNSTQCILIGVTVRGNVTAEKHALLSLRSSRIGGDVIGDKADVMQVRNNVVEGNIDIAKGGPHPVFLEVALCGNFLPNGNIKVSKMRGGIGISPFAFCVPPSRNVIVNGNLEIEKNILDVPGRRLFVSQNSVGQDLLVLKNEGPFEKIIFFNTAGASVQCFHNDPPVTGGPNFAPRREGQCF